MREAWVSVPLLKQVQLHLSQLSHLLRSVCSLLVARVPLLRLVVVGRVALLSVCCTQARSPTTAHQQLVAAASAVIAHTYAI